MLAALAFGAGTVMAETAAAKAERLAAAREVLEVTGSAKKLDAVIASLADQLREMLILKKPEHTTAITEVAAGVRDKFLPRRAELVDAIAAVYAERLTLAEMQEVVRFYKSPAGVRFASILPELTKEAWQTGQLWSANIGRDMQDAAQIALRDRGITF
jgi:hypothetical protein